MTSQAWHKTRLGDVVVAQGGLQTGPYGSQLRAEEYVADGIPVVMPRDLAGNVITPESCSQVSSDTARRLERYRLRAGDILLARRGQIGRCALVTPAQEGWLCGTGCLRARPAPPVRPDFLIQLMQWPATVAWMTENAVGQTMKNLNTRILSALPLRIPDPMAQAKIAEVLSSVDATLETTRQVLRQTAKINEGYFLRLLSRGLGHDRFRRDDSGRERPAAWREQRLGELCTFTNGRGFKAAEWSESGIPIIRIQNLNGSRDFKYFGATPKNQWIIEAGDLLFAWAGVRGTSFGPYIWNGPRGVLNQHIYRVCPRRGIVKLWLFETLRQVTREIEQHAQGFKSSLLHVRKADITAHRVAVPPRAEQQEIAERCRAARELEAIEESNLEAVHRLKQALMDDLFSGRVNAARDHRSRDRSEPH